MQYTPPLSTRFVGQHIVYRATCSSTNSLALEYLHRDLAGLPEGAVVITDRQYRGRGQRSHVWHSTPYQNLTVSVVLHPTFLSAQQSFLLNITTAAAIHHVLARYIPSGLSIKWPNDIYYHNKKLGGILIENIVQQHSIEASVIGIGLNVNQTYFTFQGPTSLALACQRTFSLQQLLVRILVRLEDSYLQLRAQNIAPLYEAYLKDMYWIREIHTFRDAVHTFQGIIKGIDPAGKLIIEQEDGNSKHYGVQEVQFVA